MISNKSVKHRALSLIALKDKGGLVYPSDSVMKVLNMSERVFKQFVSGLTPGNFQIIKTRNLHQKLVGKVVSELSPSVFANLWRHDMENSNINEDFHSTQIIKSIALKFFMLRLMRYGQEYTQSVLKLKLIGKRKQLNKLILFQGL